MKKHGNCGATPSQQPGVCVVAEADGVACPRDSKLYASRLEDLELTRKPVARQLRPVRQFHLAHLAATLATDTGKNASAGDVVAKALQIWNAAGRALFVEQQAATLLKGLFVFTSVDWEAHCWALVGLLDDIDGTLAGLSPAEQVRQSHEEAQNRAGAAVAHLWRYGPRNAEVLRGLFPGKAETDETRAAKLVELVKFAKTRVETCDELTWMAKDGDRLKGCVLHAWLPLGIPTGGADLARSALTLAAELLAKPSEASAVELGFYPMVARWLAVMRQEQAAAARKRA